ncbi:MAG: hypothetical protein AAF386_04680 [Pseudomonadota bacterium]
MKYFSILLAAGVLAACQPVVPNDYAGAGDSGYLQSQTAAAQREAALTGRPLTPIQSQPLTGTARPVAVDASPANPAPVPVAVTPLGTQPAQTAQTVATIGGNGSISDEQSFDAVAGRESIESDAARLAANRQQYQVVQPTDLPTRPGGLPNIVEYALRTNNPVGVQLYDRFAFNARNRNLRNCAAYASSDQAQQDFLARGGPQKDRRVLDPDGDGYACRWNPAPFRAARNAAIPQPTDGLAPQPVQ